MRVQRYGLCAGYTNYFKEKWTGGRKRIAQESPPFFITN